MITSVIAMLAAARKRLAAYPELAAVLVAAVIGLCVQRPLAWLAGHDGINVLLVILVFATAVTIDPQALRRLAAAWRHILVAVLVGITVLPALSWAVARLVPAGPLRDGVLVTGLAPCEIASVATTALAGGEAAVAVGVLIGSTLASVVLAGPILTLEAGHAGFSPAGVIENLAVVVALPLAAGIALRSWVPATARVLATGRAETAASRTALAAVAALVALVASEVHLAVGYLRVAAALVLFLAASAVIGRLLGTRSARPTRSALLLTTSMRDFAIAAALAAAAFGPQAAAPLGLYGIAVLIWGTAAAGTLRTRAARDPAAPAQVKNLTAVIPNGCHVRHHPRSPASPGSGAALPGTAGQGARTGGRHPQSRWRCSTGCRPAPRRRASCPACP
jgi:predicted Na+-dependent transporter